MIYDPLIEKMWLASGGLRPLDPCPGALPLDPTEGSALRLPEARARRVRHARQLAPPPCTKFKLRPWQSAQKAIEFGEITQPLGLLRRSRSPSLVPIESP